MSLRIADGARSRSAVSIPLIGMRQAMTSSYMSVCGKRLREIFT